MPKPAKKKNKRIQSVILGDVYRRMIVLEKPLPGSERSFPVCPKEQAGTFEF